MVGDPKQLPPTVKCREAEKLGLGLSMFDRLQAMGLPPLLLDVQYRMHPALCEFPSQQFYGGLLRSWPQPQDRPLPGGIAWPNPKVKAVRDAVLSAMRCWYWWSVGAVDGVAGL